MPSTPPLDDKARRKAASEKNAKTDERFYAKLREENGGELPADMVGPDGQPRKLTNGKEDSRAELSGTRRGRRSSRRMLWPLRSGPATQAGCARPA